MNCHCCKTENPTFRWTDTHGVAACSVCGETYRILHYEGDGENHMRVEKPPECLTKPEWLPVLEQYWQETKRRLPNGFDMGILSGDDSTYSGVTRDDAKAFNDWCDAHKDILPSMEESETA